MKWYTLKDRWADPHYTPHTKLIQDYRESFQIANRVWISADGKQLRFEGGLHGHVAVDISEFCEKRAPCFPNGYLPIGMRRKPQ